MTYAPSGVYDMVQSVILHCGKDDIVVHSVILHCGKDDIVVHSVNLHCGKDDIMVHIVILHCGKDDVMVHNVILGDYSCARGTIDSRVCGETGVSCNSGQLYRPLRFRDRQMAQSIYSIQFNYLIQTQIHI